MILRQVRQVRQVGSGTYSFAAVAPPPPLNIDSLSARAFGGQMSCPVGVLAAVAAPAAPASRSFKRAENRLQTAAYRASEEVGARSRTQRAASSPTATSSLPAERLFPEVH